MKKICLQCDEVYEGFGCPVCGDTTHTTAEMQRGYDEKNHYDLIQEQRRYEL